MLIEVRYPKVVGGHRLEAVFNFTTFEDGMGGTRIEASVMECGDLIATSIHLNDNVANHVHALVADMAWSRAEQENIIADLAAIRSIWHTSLMRETNCG
jgi:hypothetical protein